MSKNKLNWIEAPMPDSSPGTKLVTFFVNNNEYRSRLMLVEFPPNYPFIPPVLYCSDSTQHHFLGERNMIPFNRLRLQKLFYQ